VVQKRLLGAVLELQPQRPFPLHPWTQGSKETSHLPRHSSTQWWERHSIMDIEILVGDRDNGE